MSDPARMEELLEAFRRERNGLTADTMHYDGERYDLNYGVSLPTVRGIVRRLDAPDHELACRLLTRPEREMQLAAFHLADAARLTGPAEAERWRSALRNTELAEEAAFALLGRVPGFRELLAAWLPLAQSAPLTLYAAMRAAVRTPEPEAAWLDPMLGALRRLAADPAAPVWAPRRCAEAFTAFAARLAESDARARAAVAALLPRLGESPVERAVAEELAWRLEE